MKTLIMIFTILGLKSEVSDPSKLTKNELRFVKNVIKVQGTPEEVYKLPNGKIQVNYTTQRLTLGQDGYIHDLEILDNGQWIDLGPEY
jgi:hypothetical protein